MCDPITLLVTSAALTGGSIFAGNQAQKRVEKAQRNVRALENERQDRIQRDSQNIFDTTLQKSGAEGQKEKLAEVQAQKADEAASRVRTFSEDDFLPGTSKTNNVIRRSTQNAIQGGDVERKRRAQLAAILDAYNDVRTDRNIAQNESAQSLGQLSNFARKSAQVAQEEIAAKANDTGFWGVLAPILGAAGSAAGSAGTAGLFAPGAAATSTAGSQFTAIPNPNIPGTQFLI